LIYPSYEYESALKSKGFDYICGVDEVGRGTLAGPVMSAAVIIPSEPPKEYAPFIRDSKTLSKQKRINVFDYLSNWSICFSTGSASPQEIDNFGIVEATKMSMRRAVNDLNIKPDYLLIDALSIELLDIPEISIIKGDSLSYSIAAASIIAKVTRDRYMETELHVDYPAYDFANNKGYGTKSHLEALKSFGPSPVHRYTFRPVKLSE
tara:strand:+ start:457 stop:1077 length:621 start_codon:yes stop_codon:yes gene_type:complete